MVKAEVSRAEYGFVGPEASANIVAWTIFHFDSPSPLLGPEPMTQVHADLGQQVRPPVLWRFTHR